MTVDEITCPSCGGGLTLEYPSAKMVVCNYCGQTNYINANSLEAIGEQVLLADYGSMLKTGMKGKIKNDTFKIIGVFDLITPAGFWDEWLLMINNKPEIEYWLHEDEGDFILFSRTNLQQHVPEYNGVKVGSHIKVGEYDIFVTEKSTATVNGGEGELPFQVTPNEKADFIDGISDGQYLSIEYLPNVCEVHVGMPLSIDDIKPAELA